MTSSGRPRDGSIRLAFRRELRRVEVADPRDELAHSGQLSQTELGWSDLHDFKMHARRLRALGLTISLRIGYRLFPRGQAYLDAC